MLVGAFSLFEFYNIASKSDCRPHRIPGAISLEVIILTLSLGYGEFIQIVLAGSLMLIFLDALRLREEMNRALVSAATTLLALVYIGIPLGLLVAIKFAGENGPIIHFSPKLLTLFLACVMMADTGAYYTGRLIGRHKLAPSISPGKTIEGFLGGLVAATATVPVCKWIFFPEISLIEGIILGTLIGLLGPVGDLAESLFKRGAGIKDSSTILPGHGGFLDRLDSVLFCAPLAYIFYLFLK
jgi:phosphatidate cytidylyltransferase